MFNWADGGNLREFWQSADSHATSEAHVGAATCGKQKRRNVVLWMLTQICGLTDALKELHNEQQMRHGDLKPENILRFSDDQGSGILAIADMGLAKFHNTSTRGRNVPTTTVGGTWRYEPPEASSANCNPRSRKYDVWAMGCVILEFVTWLLYGNQRLSARNSSIASFATSKKDEKCPLDPAAQNWIDDMMYRDKRCGRDTALGDLLRLVRLRLLVPPQDTNDGYGRVTSAELHRKLTDIVKRANARPNYLSDPSLWDWEPTLKRHPSPSIQFHVCKQKEQQNAVSGGSLVNSISCFPNTSCSIFQRPFASQPLRLMEMKGKNIQQHLMPL